MKQISSLKILGLCTMLLYTTQVSAQDFPLVTPEPSCEVQGLANFIQSVYGRYIISGQMNDRWVPRILSVSGKEPAMVAYDFDGITPSQGFRNRDVPKATSWVNERGGIAQFSWHWIRPDGVGDYYDLDFDLRGALADTNSANYRAIIRDIDLAAAELIKLRDVGVPVIWRPLHEAEGGWFWWGAHGGDALRTLWRIMFERMVHHHRLNNLIWVWTSYVGDPNRPNWYPGDHMVDHIVYDYPDGNSWTAFNRTFGNSGKIFGIGENGRLPDPANFSREPWSYFLTWDYMINPVGVDRGQNSDDWIRHVFNHERVLTVDELPDYKACTPPPPPPPKLPEDNQARLQPVTVSSTDLGVHARRNAVDGDLASRWSSAYQNNQWIAVQLPSNMPVNRVVLHWEAAYASAYEVQVSQNGNTWTTVHRATNGQGGREEIQFNPVQASHVRILGVERATQWGISLFELEVYQHLAGTVRVQDQLNTINDTDKSNHKIDAAGRNMPQHKIIHHTPFFKN